MRTLNLRCCSMASKGPIIRLLCGCHYWDSIKSVLSNGNKSSAYICMQAPHQSYFTDTGLNRQWNNLLIVIRKWLPDMSPWQAWCPYTRHAYTSFPILTQSQLPTTTTPGFRPRSVSRYFVPEADHIFQIDGHFRFFRLLWPTFQAQIPSAVVFMLLIPAVLC